MKQAKPVFVTSNRNKAEEFKKFLGEDLEILSAEYPELRSEDPCEVARTAAKALCEKLERTVIVEDSGLFIEALKGFPGTYSKYVTNAIGNKGLLKLMKGIKNRKCLYKSAIGYCAPGNQPLCFIAEEEGRVAFREKGKMGWGNDPLFMPKGNAKTYGELKKPGEPGIFRIEAIKRLKDYLSRQK